MKNTIIIIGANASLAIPTVDYLLEHSPNSKLVLTVRDLSHGDVNTDALRKVVAKYAEARASIRDLDLARLPAVHDFARRIAEEISQGFLPRLASIVCTAYYWNLVSPLQLTDDGYEKTIQVSYLSHAALILRLLGSFRPEGGRGSLTCCSLMTHSCYPRYTTSVPTKHRITTTLQVMSRV